MAATAAAPKPNLRILSTKFIHKYYVTLNREPHNLKYLYAGEGAHMSRSVEGDLEPVVYQGAERIGEVMAACKELRTEISGVDHQPIEIEGKNMILIQVIGYLTEGDKPTRKFCECFVLTGTEVDGRPRYAISNDQFCYLKEEDDESYELEKLEPTQPSASKTSTAAEAKVSAPTVTKAPPKPDPAATATPPAEAPKVQVATGAPAAVPQDEPTKGPVKAPSPAEPIAAAKPTETPSTTSAEPAINGTTQPTSYAARLKKAPAPAPAAPPTVAPTSAPKAQPAPSGSGAAQGKAPSPQGTQPSSQSEAPAEDGQQTKEAARPGRNVPSARRAGDLLINSVFIGSVPQETTEDELRVLFSKAGKVLDKYVDNNQECDGVEIITTSNNNKPNAIAFVTFETDEAARRCISGDLQGSFELRGQVLNVRERKVRESRGSKTSRGRGRSGGRGRGGAPRGRGRSGGERPRPAPTA